VGGCKYLGGLISPKEAGERVGSCRCGGGLAWWGWRSGAWGGGVVEGDGCGDC
jgi:hypothetical protein